MAMRAAASALVKVSWEGDQTSKRYSLSVAVVERGREERGGLGADSHNVLKSTSKRNHSVGALTRAPLNTIHHLESS